MPAPPWPRAAAGGGDRGLVRERAPHRRGVGVADRDRERVGGVIGPRQLLEREQGLDHPLDLVLGGAAGAADRGLDLLRRVGPARDPALAGGQHHDPAGLADGEGRAHVGPEVQLLDRNRLRPVLVEQLADAGVDDREPRGGVAGRAGLDHAPVERHHPPALTPHHAVARVGGAGIDAEDDHLHGGDSARRGGRLFRRSDESRRRRQSKDEQRTERTTCCSRARTR